MSTHENMSALRMQHAGGSKRTALAASIALTLGGLCLSTAATAALPDNAVLSFTAGVVTCLVGGTPPDNCTGGLTGVSSGSYFGMSGSTNTAIAPNNGLIIGAGSLQPQPASGSHSGAPNGSENPGIDKPWGFFTNTGMHYTASIVTATDVDATHQNLDLSGWGVTWNGIALIDMGGGIQDCGTSTDNICVTSGGTDLAGTSDNGTGIAALTCGAISGGDCATNGVDFVLHYTAVVPRADPSNFGGVGYTLHLEGTIALGGPPIANDDSAATIAANPITIGVLDNDTAAADDPIDPTSIIVSTQAGNGAASANSAGTITYTPKTGPNFIGTDTFGYTVANGAGTSAPATVTVTVAVNAAPVAGDDTAASTTAVLANTGGRIANINVLGNDTDTNNSPGLPGGINTGSVSIVSNAAIGSCTANSDGTITYTQTVVQAVTETCTYKVNDIDAVNTPLSDAATLNIIVTKTTSDWDPSLPANTIPVLQFMPGIGDPDQSIKPQKSWFSMQISASTLIYTVLEPGPDGGFIIGYDQPATGSHTGAPNGSEQPGFSAPWRFFSNTGFDLTRNGGITANSDGTLNFLNKYVVTWNSIPVINLGGSSQFPEDLGFATITCSDKPCQDGSTFVLEYAAHVEDVVGLPASGFNGVPYQLYLEGTVVFLDGTPKTSEGVVTNTRLATSDASVPGDDGVDLQCVGSCFDYTVTGVTAGSRVSIVLPLSGGVPNSPVWRILDNGVWRNFDTSVGDSVKSAPFVAGPGGGMVCPAVGDAAYIDLSNDTNVNVGHQCIQLSITDDGVNDMDKTPGIVSDPSGLGTAGIIIPPDTRTSSTSGCSIAATPVNPAQRGDWWLLAGLIGLLGWIRKRCQH